MAVLLHMAVMNFCCHRRCRDWQYWQVQKGFMCLLRHQVHKWTLNRLGREVPSKFLLQRLWMPAERLQKGLTCSLEIACISAAVGGRMPGWMHRTYTWPGRCRFPCCPRRAQCRLFLNLLCQDNYLRLRSDKPA